MTDAGFDQPRPIEETTRKGVDPFNSTEELQKREKKEGLFKLIKLQMAVGSAGMILENLLSPKAREIRDLDIVTVVNNRKALERICVFFDRNRSDLGLCPNTSDVFILNPLPSQLFGCCRKHWGATKRRFKQFNFGTNKKSRRYVNSI